MARSSFCVREEIIRTFWMIFRELSRILYDIPGLICTFFRRFFPFSKNEITPSSEGVESCALDMFWGLGSILGIFWNPTWILPDYGSSCTCQMVDSTPIYRQSQIDLWPHISDVKHIFLHVLWYFDSYTWDLLILVFFWRSHTIWIHSRSMRERMMITLR